VLYLGVNSGDVFRVQLSGNAPELQLPNAHLVLDVRGSDMICTAADLDLGISDAHGVRRPLIATSLTKLTPAEIAAIPPRFRP
jgi:hypothetical protein